MRNRRGDTETRGQGDLFLPVSVSPSLRVEVL